MKAFRVKIPTLWRQASAGLLLGAFTARLLLWWEGEPFSLPNTLPLMGVAAVVVALLYLFSPTLAGPAGLKVMNAWGFRRPVAWAEIERVSFARMYFVQPALKLVTTAGRTYWIARDTKDLDGLHALALVHGGQGHPLTQALETPLHAL